VFADPRHDIHSWSGEGLIALTLGNDRLRHRFFAGYRSRNRLTETGGSLPFLRFFGEIDPENGEPRQIFYGERDRFDKPALDFESAKINSGRVRQSSWMFGYVGRLAGVGHLNIGVQKARYRARLFNGETGLTDRSRADPWLYNATLMLEITPRLSLYAATQRGLEDSGLAPESAANRNAQLPATRATQYEGGLRWDFGKGKLVLSAFQITKPYFSFDGANEFVEIGKRRHRGIEASLTGHFGERIDLVAGAAMMDPIVTGKAREEGLAGKRPAGAPKLFAQLNANYRTDLLGGLVLTGGLHYTGKRAVTARPIAHLGGKQLTLPGAMRVDFGLRKLVRIGKVDASIRTILQNIFNKKDWFVAAPDVIFPEERRKLLIILTADF
jgi:iron complex outermembrane receptor protein